MHYNSRVSTHANRIDKMSGLEKERKKLFNSNGRKVIKKSANAKRRRLLKLIIKF